MEEPIIQLIGNYGVLGLICYVFIKDFFQFLSKKNGNGKNNDVDVAVLKEQINAIMTNHLPHIQKEIEKMNDVNERVIKSLTRIEVQLEVGKK